MYNKLQKQEEEPLNISKLDLGNDAPEWAKIMSAHFISAIEASHQKLSGKLSTVITQCAENSIAIDNLEKTSDHMEARLEHMEIKYQKINDFLLRKDVETRRNNLLIHGLVEKAWETTEMIEKEVRDFLKQQLKIENVTMAFKNVYRVGARGRKNRPILVTFHDATERHAVWKVRDRIPNPDAMASKMFITQDYPLEIQARRRRLVPIFKKAKQLPEYKDATFLYDDQLNIKGIIYTIRNIHTLKGELNPIKLSTILEGDIIYLWSANSPLSNHHPSPFMVDNIYYNCVEQYYMYQRAMRSKDRA